MTFKVMKEDFITYIWKHQYFRRDDLFTSQDESIQVLNTGKKNSNAGPDFFNAQLIIGNQKWAGNVELHVKSSDWYLHGHENNTNYDTVILHVVWEDDVPVFRKDNTQIATLELSKFVDTTLLKNYKKLFLKNKWINCENEIASVDSFLFNSWLERLYFERLEQKAAFILELLKQSNNDWEAILFKLLAKNFGLKVNKEAFFELAKSIDFSIIRKEGNALNQLEALLFGQARLLQNEVENVYYQSLQNRYAYLQKKYKLVASNSSRIEFFRLRPNNFPTIRLAQLASLYHKHQNLFSRILEAKSLESYYKLFNVTASSFWDTHYSFETTSKKRVKKVTKPFINLLLINTIIPLRFIYQKHLGKLDKDIILQLIKSIKPEKNNVIEKFETFKIKATSALESQSLLQLQNGYCKQQKCLQCVVGNTLIRS